MNTTYNTKKLILKHIYTNINKFIQTKYKKKVFINFNEILNELKMSYDLYILALRNTINKKKIPQKNTQKKYLSTTT